MQRLRTLHHKQRFTQIANDAIDRLPDLNSVGLLAVYLRHHDSYAFDLKRFLREKSGVGEQAGYKARATLIDYGYIVQVKFRHSYRGRFFTDIYRSADPHTDDDYAELMRRYAPGARVTIPIGTDATGQVIEKVVTIRWAEITSWKGVELVSAVSPASAAMTFSQVAPDPGFPGPGQPGPGEPGTYKKKKEKTNKKTNTREACLPSVDKLPPPPPTSVCTPTPRPPAPPRARREEGEAPPPTTHPKAAEFVRQLPTGTKAPSKAHRRALTAEIARLLDAGADPAKLRRELLTDMANAHHRFAVYLARATQYDPAHFAPPPHRPAKAPQIHAGATSQASPPLTDADIQAAREAIHARSKNMAPGLAQRLLAKLPLQPTAEPDTELTHR